MKTPLALAIEQIEKNRYMSQLNKRYAIDILENLKPIEKEMFEETFLKGCQSEREFKPRIKCLEEYMSNLTQE